MPLHFVRSCLYSRFRGAVVVSGNDAEGTGGGIDTSRGGTTTFYGWTTIQSNTAYETGGGMSVDGQRVTSGATTSTWRRARSLSATTPPPTYATSPDGRWCYERAGGGGDIGAGINAYGGPGNKRIGGGAQKGVRRG
ncbi:unnamed protein product, partial [Laminaria digitata]